MNTNLLFRWFRRETAFFWVGMLIIPIFWAWWTLSPRFKVWQRVVAFTWLVTYSAFAIFSPLQVAAGMNGAVALFYHWWPLGCFILWASLVVRLGGWGKLLIGLIVSVDSLTILSSLTLAAMAKGEMALLPAFLVALPGLLHLVLSDWRARQAERRCLQTP